MYDRYRPVLLCVHLRQAARLVARGHEEDVGPRQDLVLELGREPNIPGDLPLVLPLCIAEEACILLISASHHDELHVTCHSVIVVHQPRENGLEKVDTLLVRKAPDEADQRHVGVLVHPQVRLNVELARPLPSQVIRAVEVVKPLELCTEVVISLRVPLALINTVEDAIKVRKPGPARLLQPPPSLGCQDLITIRGRDRYHPVRQLDASLEELDLSVVEELVKEVAVGETKVLRIAHAEVAAVPHVVDVKDGARVHVAAVSPVVRDHDQRHQADHPIVDEEDTIISKDAAVAVDAEGGLEGRPREHGEAHKVIVVSVHAMPLIATVLHKHVVHAKRLAPRLGRRGRRLAPLPPVLDAVLLPGNPKLLHASSVLAAVIAPVQRSNSHHPVAHAGERHSQLVAHVRQAP
mmetsp:Transcript_32659/g.76272  ORF Transcript_32659/g.76272 Transcript_32659/m.76272 type:complete len:407 (-) Transcript_32659:455-1675(-)